MQTLGARFQMRRVSLEPGRQPEAGMGSQIVERAVGSVAWAAYWLRLWINYRRRIYISQYRRRYIFLRP